MYAPRRLSVQHTFSFMEDPVELPVPCSAEVMAEVDAWLVRNDDEDEATRTKELFGEAGGDIQGRVGDAHCFLLRCVAERAAQGTAYLWCFVLFYRYKPQPKPKQSLPL